MDNDLYFKEVYFDQYCKTCKHEKEDENDEDSACFECLHVPARQFSHKPEKWEEKK